jgi:hypothetical protein
VLAGGYAKSLSFIVQDSFQGFHWKIQQVTIHPFLHYFKNPNFTTEELLHLSYDAISVYLINTAAVYTFQNSLILYLKETA